MTTFLFLLAWSAVGVVVFSLIWRYIWLPKIYDNNPNVLDPIGVLFGTIFWPIVLGGTLLVYAAIGIGKCILLLPLDSYWNWMNGRLPKPKKDIQA